MFQQYQTKPLECWQRAKELRIEHFHEITTARDQGKLVVTGGADGFMALPAGLGDYVYLSGEPYGASVGTDPVFSPQCAEACEARGFARDLCAYLRNYLGSMFLNRFFMGGEFPRPDFCLQLHWCDSHAKWFQTVAEHFGVPSFIIDCPLGPRSKERDEVAVQYLVDQMHEAVAWMERVTGQEYNDERLLEALRNEFESTSLWAGICTLNKAIPAPLDEKSMFSLYIIGVMARPRKESAEFYRMLRDEMRDRVANQIAAIPNERCRLLHDGQPPWQFLRLFRHLEHYGAVVLGSAYSFNLAGHFSDQEDGSLGPSKTPEERGWPLKTRDDAFRALARWYVEKPLHSDFICPGGKSDLMLRLVREWQADGVLMHLNRGCEGASLGQMENRLGLLQAGIPVATYEGNMADKRELDQRQILDRIESFMESLGLRQLGD